MRIEILAAPSEAQVRRHGPLATWRMLDWHAVNRDQQGNVRLAVGDFAHQPQTTWEHSTDTLQRGMPVGEPVDCGEIAAREMAKYFRSPEAMYCFQSVAAMRLASRKLLKTCMEHDSSLRHCTAAEARERIRVDRNMAPVTPLAILDIRRENDHAIVHAQTAGDVFFALNSAGRTVEDVHGMIHPKKYDGQPLLGQGMNIDRIKASLKAAACERWPGMPPQFFYELIYLAKVPADEENFAGEVRDFLQGQAWKLYEIGSIPFHQMMQMGMNAWQRKFAQNNPQMGGFAYSTLDPVDPPMVIHHARFCIRELSKEPHPSLLLWTDGLRPSAEAPISLDNLKPTNPEHGERTAVEVILDGGKEVQMLPLRRK